MTSNFINKWMLALKNQFDERKTRLTRSEIRVAVTSKAWRDSGRESFSPSGQVARNQSYVARNFWSSRPKC